MVTLYLQLFIHCNEQRVLGGCKWPLSGHAHCQCGDLIGGWAIRAGGQTHLFVLPPAESQVAFFDSRSTDPHSSVRRSRFPPAHTLSSFMSRLKRGGAATRGGFGFVWGGGGGAGANSLTSLVSLFKIYGYTSRAPPFR